MIDWPYLIDNWSNLITGSVIFALTCALPLLARRTKVPEIKSMLGIVDAFGSLLAWALIALAFENLWIGLFAVSFGVAVTGALASFFHKDGAWGSTYWPREPKGEPCVFCGGTGEMKPAPVRESQPWPPETSAPKETLSLYTAHFAPQAWIRDYAYAVDPEGPTTWDATEFVAKADPEWLAATLEHGDHDDILRTDPNAPFWVREWTGPFETYLTVTKVKPAP